LSNLHLKGNQRERMEKYKNNEKSIKTINMQALKKNEG